MSDEKRTLIAVEAKGLQVSISGTRIILIVPAESKESEPIEIDLMDGIAKMSRNDRCRVHDFAFSLLADKLEEADAKRKAEETKVAKAAKAEADKKAQDEKAAQEKVEADKAEAQKAAKPKK